MKLLLDTNIVIDVALERQPYFESSQQVLLLVEQERIKKNLMIKVERKTLISIESF